MAGIVAALAAVGLVALLVLSHLPVFVISGIDATASEHVSAETIAKLAAVDEGTTLLSVDVSQIQQNVRKNPWVKNVNVTREFPDTLGVTVEERTVSAIVVMGSGDSGARRRRRPARHLRHRRRDLPACQGERAGVPFSPSPWVRGRLPRTRSSTPKLSATFESITSQAQVYYAASTGSISVVLQSGLEISLGSATDISAKASALQTVLDAYGDQLTYVNVRVPSKPSYRKVADGTSLGGAAKVVADNAATAAAATAQTADASTDESEGDDEDGGESDSSSRGDGSEGDAEGSAYADEGE